MPEPTLKADNSSELQVQWAYMRRGLALDQCGLVEWTTHQQWVQYLLGMLSKRAPEGYQKVRMDQIIKEEDRKLFMILSDELQQRNARLSDTPSRGDEGLRRLRTDPRVTMHFLPLPASHKSGSKLS